MAAALLVAALASASCSTVVPSQAFPEGGSPTGGGGTATAADVSCEGTNVVEVSTAQQLQAALDGASPGAVIRLARGSYAGQFTAGKAGTEQAPIVLCGPPEAVLEGGGPKDGYTLHLENVTYWRLAGFAVHGGQKGVVIDRSTAVTVEGLQISDIGDEGLHLRQFSSDNIVRGNTVRRTGLRSEKFGEGIYVGSAESNWCTYSDCGPDKSDHNLIEGNDISETTAESVDIKEGTTGGILRGNTFSGKGMSDSKTWVNVKGNEWQIVDNVGTDAPEDGFQVQRILDGWGARNVFEGNTATVNGPGFGINIVKKEDGNRVACSNKVDAAAKGLSNIDCG